VEFNGTSEMSLIYSRNKRGPRMDPCGTPDSTARDNDGQTRSVIAGFNEAEMGCSP